MSHANRGRLLKNTVFLYFRLVVTLGVSLYTSRVVLNALGIEDYGIHNVVAGAVAMVAFLNGAMASATQRFISFEVGKGSSNDQISRVFSTALIIHIGIALLILASGLPLGLWMVHHVLTIPDARLDAAIWVVVCAVFTLMAHVMLAPFTALILSRERMGVYAYMSILDAAIKLTIAFMLGIGGFDRLKLYAVLLLLGAILLKVAYIVYCRLSFEECRLTRQIEWSKAREMTSFVSWNLSNHIAAMVANQGVNVLLNIYFGPVVNASRGIAMQASGALQGFTSNLQAASAPQIVKTYSAGEFEAERGLIIFSSKLTLFLFLIIGLPIFLEATQVLHLWLGKVPPHADTFLKLVMIHSMTMVASNPLLQAILATGRIKIFTVISTTLVIVGAALSWLLLEIGGQPSAVFFVAIGVSISILCLRLMFLRKMIAFSTMFFMRQVINPAMLILTIGGLVPVLLHLNLAEGMPRVAAVFATSFICLPMAVYALGLTSRERSQIKRKLVDRLSAFKGYI